MIRKPTQTSNESGIQEHIGVYWPDGDKFVVKIPARYRQFTGARERSALFIAFAVKRFIKALRVKHRDRNNERV